MLSVASLVSASVLVFLDSISTETYQLVVQTTVGVYIAGNVGQGWLSPRNKNQPTQD